MSLVTTRGRSHHGVEVVVRRRLRFLRVEHGDALHFFVPDTFFQQLRLNKQFVGDKGVVVLHQFFDFYLFSEGPRGARLPCFWSQSLVRGVLPRNP